MVVTYYADLIFFWNFVMDFFLLFLIHPDSKKQYWRLIVAAAIGGSAALLMLYLSFNAVLLFFVLRFFWAGVMVKVGIPAKGIGEFLCNTALLYGISSCLYGVSKLVFERTEVFTIILSLGILLSGKTLYRFRKKQNQRLNYQLRIKMKNGQQQVEKKAFYDSGNHLFEPISGKPVILVRNSVAKQLKFCAEKLRVVPYSSLGNASGMLEAYPLEEVVICNEKNKCQFKHIYMAVAEDTMFVQEDCEVILHAELWGGREL